MKTNPRKLCENSQISPNIFSGFFLEEVQIIWKPVARVYPWKTSNLSSFSHTESMLEELANLSPEKRYIVSQKSCPSLYFISGNNESYRATSCNGQDFWDTQYITFRSNKMLYIQHIFRISHIYMRSQIIVLVFFLIRITGCFPIQCKNRITRHCNLDLDHNFRSCGSERGIDQFLRVKIQSLFCLFFNIQIHISLLNI